MVLPQVVGVEWIQIDSVYWWRDSEHPCLLTVCCLNSIRTKVTQRGQVLARKIPDASAAWLYSRRLGQTRRISSMDYTSDSDAPLNLKRE